MKVAWAEFGSARSVRATQQWLASSSHFGALGCGTLRSLQQHRGRACYEFTVESASCAGDRLLSHLTSWYVGRGGIIGHWYQKPIPVTVPVIG